LLKRSIQYIVEGMLVVSLVGHFIGLFFIARSFGARSHVASDFTTSLLAIVLGLGGMCGASSLWATSDGLRERAQRSWEGFAIFLWVLIVGGLALIWGEVV